MSESDPKATLAIGRIPTDGGRLSAINIASLSTLPMYVDYDDILDRIAETPLWWSNGVPRYAEFRPYMIDVYVHAALLVRGRCQVCAKPFTIAVAGQVPKLISEAGDAIGPWGDDPPFHYVDRPTTEDNRCVGNSMTFVEEEILEAWWRAPVRVRRRLTKDGEEWGISHRGSWTRLPHLEGPASQAS